MRTTLDKGKMFSIYKILFFSNASTVVNKEKTNIRNAMSDVIKAANQYCRIIVNRPLIKAIKKKGAIHNVHIITMKIPSPPEGIAINTQRDIITPAYTAVIVKQTILATKGIQR